MKKEKNIQMSATQAAIPETQDFQLSTSVANLPRWLAKLSDISEKPRELESSFMPYAFIASEKVPAPQKKQHLYVVSNQTVELVAPVKLVWFAARKSVRQLVGTAYKNRAYLGGKSESLYLEKLEECEQGNDAVKIGEVALVYLESEAFSGFVTVEQFGRQGDFWSVWFNAGYWRDRNYVSILKTDFTDCLTISRTGNKYLSCWKNKAWRAIKIDKEMADRILAASEACKSQIDFYFSM